MLAKAPRLRVVARAGVGLDNVDVEACARRGVAVLNTPDANTRAVVEYVTSMALDALRPRVYLEDAPETKAWKRMRSEMIAPRQLSEMTLGILGLGKIGSQVARVGAALDMRVIYHDIAEIEPQRRHGAVPVDRETLFRESDLLTIHVDGRAENHGVVEAASLALCKPDVVLVNTSRGFVVENDALAAFLKANPGAMAMLDVHEPEPFPPHYPLLGLANAKLSPHLASATARAHKNMSWVVKDLWRVLSAS
jgi:phosphoglycerate dehydrogenase-like enzyme